MKLLTLLLVACAAEPTVSASLYLPQGITAAEARFVTLTAIDQAKFPESLTPLDLCQRFIQRTSFPDLDKALAPETFDLMGVSGSEKMTLDGVPGATYTLLVEAADTNPRTSTRTTLRGCAIDIGVQGGRTTEVFACLCAIDDTNRVTCPPVSMQCPAAE